MRLRRNDPRVRKAPRAIRVWNFEQMRAFAAGGRPEVRAATKRPVDRRRKKPGPERFFSPHDFEALILTPGLTGLRVSGVNFRPAGPSRLAGARSARPPGFAPRAPYPIWVDQFQPAEVAQFSTGLDSCGVIGDGRVDAVEVDHERTWL